MTTYSKNFGLAKPRAQLYVNAPSSIRAEPNATLTLRQAASLRCPPPPVNTLNTLNTLTKSMSASRGSLQIAGKTLTASLTTEAAPSPSDRRHSLQLKTFQSRSSKSSGRAIFDLYFCPTRTIFKRNLRCNPKANHRSMGIELGKSSLIGPQMNYSMPLGFLNN